MGDEYFLPTKFFTDKVGIILFHTRINSFFFQLPHHGVSGHPGAAVTPNVEMVPNTVFESA